MNDKTKVEGGARPSKSDISIVGPDNIYLTENLDIEDNSTSKYKKNNGNNKKDENK